MEKSVEALIKGYEELAVFRELKKASLKPKIVQASTQPRDGKVSLSIYLEGTDLVVETFRVGTWQLCRRTGVEDPVTNEELTVPVKPKETPKYESVLNAMKNTGYTEMDTWLNKMTKRRK